jgi:predicted ABC-class ATPase
MNNKTVLKQKIYSIENKDYEVYQSLIGEYEFGTYQLLINQIPKDPYAPPHTGIYRIRLAMGEELMTGAVKKIRIRETAFRDFFARRFYTESSNISKSRRGTGYSGVITLDRPGQVILERSSVVIDKSIIEVRFFIGLPANGRRINAKLAEEMIFEELPEIVSKSLLTENLDEDELLKHIEAAEDAEILRALLSDLNLVAIIANGSVLPRESGASDRPLENSSVVPFVSPERLQVEIELPHAGVVKGMGIPKGVTLIVGGGFHGKSTLLKAIEQGIYNHVPGDGREFCVSDYNTVKVRSYSGRYVEKTDISTFISNLPYQKDTTDFSTSNASGSTSQAASIIEAVELGATILLMDEDTCATNFMVRDWKMQKLVVKEDEPITAFIDKVRQLYEEKGVSTIIVSGGVGDYFTVSDTIIQMKSYVPHDVTNKARKLADNVAGERAHENANKAIHFKERFPDPVSINPYNNYGKKSIYAKERERFVFGNETVDLSDIDQLIELSQTKALAFSLDYLKIYADGKTSLKQILDKVMGQLAEKGLDIIFPNISGHFAWFRSFELGFALNRLRSLRVKQGL